MKHWPTFPSVTLSYSVSPMRHRRMGHPRQPSLARRLVTNSGVADPARVDRMLGAYELHVCRLALGIGLKRAPQRGNDLRRLRHILRMKALRSGHGGHAGLVVVRDGVGIGVMPAPPESGAIAREASVVDVNGGD